MKTLKKKRLTKNMKSSTKKTPTKNNRMEKALWKNRKKTSFSKNLMEEVGKSRRVKVSIPTDRILILDQALLRPGRIDIKIEFPNPNEEVFPLIATPINALDVQFGSWFYFAFIYMG
ncbi:hypothetical protein Vadar_004054 [Vaccinium darrowii]|uniref:Uncharacterized protein n=1 Tax=Vaccinium darrowii TaxID=229202 RepID=A0ACB7XXC3_9ERIC|nr:hypothetical protein Vadar_004054 [Vaccinium darrowii]